jgi:MoxR-like ATPase
LLVQGPLPNPPSGAGHISKLGIMEKEIQAIHEMVQVRSAFVEALLTEVRRSIVGQKYLLDRLLIGILTGGHVLVEGVPGLAKTLSVRSFAAAINATFKRIQFTPDLLPADLIGTLIFNPREGTFAPRKGPIFAQVILADEINRAPAKVQSALLEAMQEQQVTIGDTTYPLPEPFLVMATQNPIEQEGTYPLPEAQIDRFMLKLKVDYPTRDDEMEILERVAIQRPPVINRVVDAGDILESRRAVAMVYVDQRIKEYVVNLVLATRQPKEYGLDIGPLLEFGASPRATIFLIGAAQAHAFIRGRGYVTPEDIKAIGPDVLRHRVILSYEAEAEDVSAEDIVRRVFDAVPVP